MLGTKVEFELELDEQISIQGIAAATVSGFQHAIVYGRLVVVRGNHENNYLSVWGCELRVDGEGGSMAVSADHVAAIIG